MLGVVRLVGIIVDGVGRVSLRDEVRDVLRDLAGRRRHQVDEQQGHVWEKSAHSLLPVNTRSKMPARAGLATGQGLVLAPVGGREVRAGT